MPITTQDVHAWLSHTRDAVLGSDPGLIRLRTAIVAAAAMSGALAIEFAYARLAGADTMGIIVSMLLGAMSAMMGSNALSSPSPLENLRTASLFPVALGAGLGLGILVGNHHDLMLVVFVAVMFVAVFVRRFGMPFFFYGFMLWMGYFFASFLHATAGMLPQLLLAAVIGTLWVLLLSVTVARTSPRRSLLRVRRSFDARARRLARACAYLVMTDPDDPKTTARRHARVRAQRGRLAEAALMIDGWAADRDALPEGWTAAAVRRRLVDLQMCLGTLAAASQDLVGADQEIRRMAVQALWPLALRNHSEARAAAERMRDVAADLRGDQGRAAAHLADGVLEYTRIAPDTDPPDITNADDDEFTPAASLALGNLPGSAAVVKDVAARGHRWNPLARLDFTTRQALQVAVAGGLAILFGRMLDPYRYYWAVIAAFVAFAGTGTRSETTLKAVNRVIGTLVGLFAGILLAHATAGHTVWTLAVIVLSMSAGFYLVRVSYAYMIFFVTIMVAQLYMVLHEFSDQLLVLRLEETALGGAIGIAVGLLVTPVSTRDTVESARRDLLTAMADFLSAAGAHLDPSRPTPLPDLDAPLRELDNRLRALLQVAAPLTRPMVVSNSPRWARHRLTLYAESVRAAQGLTRSLRSVDDGDTQLATATECLARIVTDMSTVPVAIGGPPSFDPAGVTAAMEHVDRAIGLADPASPGLVGAAHDLTRLHRVLDELVHLRRPDRPDRAGLADRTARASSR